MLEIKLILLFYMRGGRLNVVLLVVLKILLGPPKSFFKSIEQRNDNNKNNCGFWN